MYDAGDNLFMNFFILFIAGFLLASCALIERDRQPAQAQSNLIQDAITEELYALQFAETFIEQKGLRVPEETKTSLKRCFNLGSAMAGAHFLLFGKGPEYKLASLNGMAVSEAHNQLVALSKKYCGNEALSAFDFAQGANWNQIAKSLIEASYYRRSPYDQRLLEDRMVPDMGEPYDETAVENSPKTTNLCFEMGAIDFFGYNASNFGNTELILSFNNGSKKIPFNHFKNNFRYRENGCPMKKIPLP